MLFRNYWIFPFVSAYTILDPNFYIPLSAIEAGHGELLFPGNTDIDDDSLIHLGSLTVPGLRPPAKIALINQGPLRGLVKVPFESLGKCHTSCHVYLDSADMHRR